MRDDDNRHTTFSVSDKSFDALPHYLRALGVQAGGGFIQDEDFGSTGEGSCDDEALGLPAGETDAAVADGSGVPAGEGGDELVDVCCLGSCANVFGRVEWGRGFEAVADIVANGSGEEAGGLRDDRDEGAEGGDVQLADVAAADCDCWWIGFRVRRWVETEEEGGDCGFAGAGGADDGGAGVCWDGDVEVSEDDVFEARGVGEVEVDEVDGAGIENSEVTRMFMR